MTKIYGESESPCLIPLSPLKYHAKPPFTEIENLGVVKQLLIQPIKVLGVFKIDNTSIRNPDSKSQMPFADQS